MSPDGAIGDAVVSDGGMADVAISDGAISDGASPDLAPAQVAFGFGVEPGFAAVGGAILAGSADFDGDGKLDLAVGSATDPKAAILLGRGDGTLKQPILAALPGPVNAGCVADFNEDGRPDVAFAVYMVGVAVLLNQQNGTLGAPAVVGSSALEIACGDLDGDGHADLISSELTSFSVLRGDGKGGFGAAASSVLSSAPRQVALLDLTGDGHPEVILVDDAVDVLVNNGKGLLLAPTRTAITQPGGVAAGDLDGDGKVDLVVGVFQGNAPNLLVLLGLGNGSFKAPLSYCVSFAGAAAGVSDLDGDGKLDVVVSDASSDDAAVFHGNGDGTLNLKAIYQVGRLPFGMLLDDFNGDGKADLVLPNYPDGEIDLLVNAGDGSFRAPRAWPTSPHGCNVKFLSFFTADSVVDWDGDGRLDVVAVDQQQDEFDVLTGDGSGHFSAPTAQAANLPVSANIYSVVPGDFDGDGHLDLALGGASQGGLIEIDSSDGKGTILSSRAFSVANYPWGMAAADFDGDGSLDIAAAIFDAIVVLRRPFDKMGPLIGNYPSSHQQGATLTTIDLDGDGHLDLVAADPSGDAVDISWGVGDGTFVATMQIAVGGKPLGSAFADWNGDGVLDVAVATSAINNATSAAILLGAGQRAFTLPSLLGSGYGGGVAAADLDGDGKPDLAVIEETATDPTIGLYRGHGDGTFTLARRLPTGLEAQDLAAVDFDDDGRTDLVTLAGQSAYVAVYLNR